MVAMRCESVRESQSMWAHMCSDGKQWHAGDWKAPPWEFLARKPSHTHTHQTANRFLIRWIDFADYNAYTVCTAFVVKRAYRTHGEKRAAIGSLCGALMMYAWVTWSHSRVISLLEKKSYDSFAAAWLMQTHTFDRSYVISVSFLTQYIRDELCTEEKCMRCYRWSVNVAWHGPTMSINIAQYIRSNKSRPCAVK